VVMTTISKIIPGASLLVLLVACSSGSMPETQSGGPEAVPADNAEDAARLVSSTTGRGEQGLLRSRHRAHRRPRHVDACASVRCAAGTHCEADGRSASCVADDPCALTDCPPDRPVCTVIDAEAVCQAAEPPPADVFCGGIAAFECPGAGSCVDDPDDACDPTRGGADCGGICQCEAGAILCAPNTLFNADPGVCACVPEEPPVDACAAVRCAAGTHCELVGDAATCAADDACALADCPPDRPQCEVVDNEAVCTAAQPSVFCGGIAAFQCPGSASCVDNPNDGCDPTAGGADCGGICECNILALCIRGFSFDRSPSVCACVPSDSPPAAP
jgi:hypothetical protein